ncbi:MAG: DNA internalization-related competence protein ComEC/Rec2 [Methylococcales bacterium]|nr:DNA internalization-related competence protein ComEC/Rec2 [Methylococcales bacterium]
MITSALLFVAGIICVQQFSELPSLLWLSLMAISAIIMVILRYWRWVFFIVGLLWAVVFATQRLNDRLSPNLERLEIPVTGIIVDLPDYNSTRTSFDFVVTQAPYALPSKIHLSWYFPTQIIKSGQRWSFVVKLKRPQGSLNPGGYDYEQYLFSRGIGAIGYVRTETQPQLLGRISAWFSIAVWRQAISDAIGELLPNSPSLGLIKALTIGDSSLISKDDWDIFRKTGTTHLVVISGSHVGLIAGLAYFWVLKIWARIGYLKWSPQTVAAIVGIVVAVFYAGLAGFSVPTQRAVVMFSVWMLAIVWQRHSRPFNTLALSLIAVLLYDPIAVLSVGFWLSFLAVSLIVYVIAGRLGSQNSVVEMLKINGATALGLSPVLLLFFQQVSLISPVANFIAVPIISFIAVPLALLGVIAMGISTWLATHMFGLADYSLQALRALLALFAQFSYATYNHSQPPVWSLLFSIPAVLILLAPAGFPYRYLALLLFLPLFANNQPTPKAGSFKLTVLDVGQALAIVIQTAQHSLIFDTGSKYSTESNSGKTIILPFLRHENIVKVDTLMVSHGDNDHIGGADSILQSMPVTEVLTTAIQQLHKYQPIKCAAGQTWVWDNVHFSVLAPQQAFESDNNNACVLLVKTPTLTVLLPSDIEVAAESWLTARYGDDLKADILIAPHHGSKTSSNSYFLSKVKPTVVLISSGHLNQFGHPHSQVTERYKQQSIDWLNTAEQGALSLNEQDGLWSITSTRDTDGKYWNNKPNLKDIYKLTGR